MRDCLPVDCSGSVRWCSLIGRGAWLLDYINENGESESGGPMDCIQPENDESEGAGPMNCSNRMVSQRGAGPVDSNQSVNDESEGAGPLPGLNINPSGLELMLTPPPPSPLR